jgi:outer membrane protein OmpA-like peptidoglycan-associated protein
MYRNTLKVLSVMVCFAAVLATIPASAVELHVVQFPEKRPVQLPFTATSIAPAADIEAEVVYRQGQARIDLSYDDIKPAILFGGDITCFVVWAVTRDGQYENLGELWTRKLSGRLKFSTGKKNFALIVTAESFYLVGRPSELVVFHNMESDPGEAVSSRFTFNDFAEAPRHSMDGIAHIIWDSKVPLDLLQARKAHELAQRHDAQKYAGRVYAEASAMLRSANSTAATAPKSRELLDYARRAVALSNEALNISMHRLEAQELERKIAERRAETQELERRAAEAEAAATAARRLSEEARAEQERLVSQTAALQGEKTRLESAMLSLNQEKNNLQGESARLLQEKLALEAEATRLREDRAALQAESKRLEQERDQLKGRLHGALSHVAETEESVRGLVVSLPDILFDLNEATLKTEAQLVLAKLTGILLIMPDQGLTIEGHTDSTGSAGYNLDLSQRRATAVQYFLQSQGLDAKRMNAVGFGMQRPVADNATSEGRSRNRRVEIVISESSSTLASR